MMNNNGSGSGTSGVGSRFVSYCGIENVGEGGGTCYIAACLQLLYHGMPELRDALLLMSESGWSMNMDMHMDATASYSAEHAHAHTLTIFVDQLSHLFQNMHEKGSASSDAGAGVDVGVCSNSIIVSTVNPCKFYDNILQWDGNTPIDYNNNLMDGSDPSSGSGGGGDAGNMMSLLLWHLSKISVSVATNAAANAGAVAVEHDVNVPILLTASHTNTTHTHTSTTTCCSKDQKNHHVNVCAGDDHDDDHHHVNVNTTTTTTIPDDLSSSLECRLTKALHLVEGKSFQTLYVRRNDNDDDSDDEDEDDGSDNDASGSGSSSSDGDSSSDSTNDNDSEEQDEDNSSSSCSSDNSNSHSHNSDDDGESASEFWHWKQQPRPKLFRGPYPVSVIGHSSLRNALLHSTIYPQHIPNYKWSQPNTSNTTPSSYTSTSHDHDHDHDCYQQVCDKLTFRKIHLDRTCPPQHLMLQLKRFHIPSQDDSGSGSSQANKNNPDTNDKMKIPQKYMGRVHVPLDMNLTKLFEEPLENSNVTSKVKAATTATSTTSQSLYCYTLRGAIIHAGRGLDMTTEDGHYFCIMRSNNDKNHDDVDVNKEACDSNNNNNTNSSSTTSINNNSSSCWTILDDEHVTPNMTMTKQQLGHYLDGGPKAKWYDDDETLPQCAMVVLYSPATHSLQK
jgi:hypothetical protein